LEVSRRLKIVTISLRFLLFISRSREKGNEKRREGKDTISLSAFEVDSIYQKWVKN
jgi:hypothetical protein